MSMRDRVQAMFTAPVAEAHCDGPCGVYDPASARVTAEAVLSMTKKMLDLHVPEGSDDAAWARAVATTEVTRASSQGALDAYRAQGVTGLRWLTEQDRMVCPVCQANEDAGPVPLGAAFPSGDLMPPAHPNCRCAPLPA